MITKYQTGQAVKIPGFIRSAREENGVVIYDVEPTAWEGIREDEIEPSGDNISREAVKALLLDLKYGR